MCACACVCVSVRVRVCVYVRACVNTFLRACVCACMCIYDGGMLIAYVKKDMNNNVLHDIHTAIVVLYTVCKCTRPPFFTCIRVITQASLKYPAIL